MRCDGYKDWWYECDICKRRFPIWWVSEIEWQEAGFGNQDVCKSCFEEKLPNPRYFSVDEYISDQIEYLLKDFPGVPSNELNAFSIVIKHQLEKVWDSEPETDEHRLCRQAAEVTKKACLVSNERKRQEKTHIELCNEHPTLVGLNESTLRPVITEKDPEIKELVIEQIAAKKEKEPITSKDVVNLIEATRASRLSPSEKRPQATEREEAEVAEVVEAIFRKSGIESPETKAEDIRLAIKEKEDFGPKFNQIFTDYINDTKGKPPVSLIWINSGNHNIVQGVINDKWNGEPTFKCPQCGKPASICLRFTCCDLSFTEARDLAEKNMIAHIDQAEANILERWKQEGRELPCRR
jgi:hypothetical protein